MEQSKYKPRCFFDINIGNEPAGRIIFELFNDICPKATENFRKLCTGVCGVGVKTKKPLHFQKCTFHRIIKGFMIQGGDFSNGDGTGGESIYGGTFGDECLTTPHDRPYLLSMANRGVNTNGSQFFITTVPAPHLNGKHVLFGHVIVGQDVVCKVENAPVDGTHRPINPVIIANCGELIPVTKKKKKKERVSISQSSEEEDSDREMKKKKKIKKERKKKKKAPKHSDSADNNEDSELLSRCSVRTEEIPEVPKPKFLYRQSPPKDKPVRDDRLQQGDRYRRYNENYDESGTVNRRVKGRGNVRYQMSRSRSRSLTPPHWRKAEMRGQRIKEEEFRKMQEEKLTRQFSSHKEKQLYRESAAAGSPPSSDSNDDRVPVRSRRAQERHHPREDSDSGAEYDRYIQRKRREQGDSTRRRDYFYEEAAPVVRREEAKWRGEREGRRREEPKRRVDGEARKELVSYGDIDSEASDVEKAPIDPVIVRSAQKEEGEYSNSETVISPPRKLLEESYSDTDSYNSYTCRNASPKPRYKTSPDRPAIPTKSSARYEVSSDEEYKKRQPRNASPPPPAYIKESRRPDFVLDESRSSKQLPGQVPYRVKPKQRSPEDVQERKKQLYDMELASDVYKDLEDRVKKHSLDRRERHKSGDSAKRRDSPPPQNGAPVKDDIVVMEAANDDVGKFDNEKPKLVFTKSGEVRPREFVKPPASPNARRAFSALDDDDDQASKSSKVPSPLEKDVTVQKIWLPTALSKPLDPPQMMKKKHVVELQDNYAINIHTQEEGAGEAKESLKKDKVDARERSPTDKRRRSSGDSYKKDLSAKDAYSKDIPSKNAYSKDITSMDAYSKDIASKDAPFQKADSKKTPARDRLYLPSVSPSSKSEKSPVRLKPREKNKLAAAEAVARQMNRDSTSPSPLRKRSTSRSSVSLSPRREVKKPDVVPSQSKPLRPRRSPPPQLVAKWESRRERIQRRHRSRSWTRSPRRHSSSRRYVRASSRSWSRSTSPSHRSKPRRSPSDSGGRNQGKFSLRAKKPQSSPSQFDTASSRSPSREAKRGARRESRYRDKRKSRTPDKKNFLRRIGVNLDSLEWAGDDLKATKKQTKANDSDSDSGTSDSSTSSSSASSEKLTTKQDTRSPIRLLDKALEDKKMVNIKEKTLPTGDKKMVNIKEKTLPTGDKLIPGTKPIPTLPTSFNNLKQTIESLNDALNTQKDVLSSKLEALNTKKAATSAQKEPLNNGKEETTKKKETSVWEEEVVTSGASVLASLNTFKSGPSGTTTSVAITSSASQPITNAKISPTEDSKWTLLPLPSANIYKMGYEPAVEPTSPGSTRTSEYRKRSRSPPPKRRRRSPSYASMHQYSSRSRRKRRSRSRSRSYRSSSYSSSRSSSRSRSRSYSRSDSRSRSRSRSSSYSRSRDHRSSNTSRHRRDSSTVTSRSSSYYTRDRYKH